ncbi:MAG TPA: hypothetical protein VMP67_08660 [Candidatus Limnocylindria bacterium]|nr:hypothetical protein [Candidatus Limnocylindria bacterium]
MSTQVSQRGHGPSIRQRISSRGQSLARRVDSVLYRGQLGPTRGEESRSFGPGRGR